MYAMWTYQTETEITSSTSPIEADASLFLFKELKDAANELEDTPVVEGNDII